MTTIAPQELRQVLERIREQIAKKYDHPLVIDVINRSEISPPGQLAFGAITIYYLAYVAKRKLLRFIPWNKSKMLATIQAERDPMTNKERILCFIHDVELLLPAVNALRPFVNKVPYVISDEPARLSAVACK